MLAHRASLRPHLVEKYEIKVDSCGTAAYHVGEEPDERTVATCQKVSPGRPVTSIGCSRACDGNSTAYPSTRSPEPCLLPTFATFRMSLPWTATISATA